jgi:hypothetical protein
MLVSLEPRKELPSMSHVIEVAMWLMLLASILVAFSTLLLEFILKDSTRYDMEFIWNDQYTHQDLQLPEPSDP